jgi:hypothetical protein
MAQAVTKPMVRLGRVILMEPDWVTVAILGHPTQFLRVTMMTPRSHKELMSRYLARCSLVGLSIFAEIIPGFSEAFPGISWKQYERVSYSPC